MPEKVISYREANEVQRWIKQNEGSALIGLHDSLEGVWKVGGDPLVIYSDVLQRSQRPSSLGDYTLLCSDKHVAGLSAMGINFSTPNR